MESCIECDNIESPLKQSMWIRYDIIIDYPIISLYYKITESKMQAGMVRTTRYSQITILT